MARIRSIHPGLTTDESFMSMSMTAKAAWTPLWMHCDDHGVFEWKPVVLKATIFPADNVDFAAVLQELVTLDCVRQVDVGGRSYGLVRNFMKYQRPKKPSYKVFKDGVLPNEYANYVSSPSAISPPVPDQSDTGTENDPQRKEEVGGKEGIEPHPSGVRGARARSDVPRETIWKPIPSDWKPSADNLITAVAMGLSQAEIDRLVKKFRAHYRANGETRVDWCAQFDSWLADEKPQSPAPVPGDASRLQTYFAEEGSERFNAWDEYFRRTRGRGAPMTDLTIDNVKRRGWRFESEWPPGHKVEVAA